MRKPWIALLLAFTAFAYACTNMPEYTTPSSEISVEMLGLEQLERLYGRSVMTNPFIPYRSLFFGAREEFYVVYVSVSDGYADIELVSAEFKSRSPFLIEPFYRSDMLDYWLHHTEESQNPKRNQDQEKRNELVASVVFPASGVIRIEPGKPAALVFKSVPPRLALYGARINLKVNGEPREYEVVYPRAEAEQ